MNLLIDTNVYLNFYRRSNLEKIKSITILTKLLKEKKIQLILPRQIEDEFLRNRQAKSFFTDQVIKLEELLTINKVDLPNVVSTVKYKKRLDACIRKLGEIKKSLIDEYRRKIEDKNSAINKKIQKLFDLSFKKEESIEVLQNAHFRTLRGNPPKKGTDSFGDAIIWELILDELIDDDLFIISADRDFASERRDGELHELLQKEWKERSKKKIKLYMGLGEFLNSEFKTTSKISKKELAEEKKAERVNSDGDFYSKITALYGSENSNSVISPVYSLESFSLNVKTCSCCGAKFRDSTAMRFSYSVNLNSDDKCPDCQGLFPTYCSKCGKHYHRDALSGFSDDVCSSCRGRLF